MHHPIIVLAVCFDMSWSKVTAVRMNIFTSAKITSRVVVVGVSQLTFQNTNSHFHRPKDPLRR